MKKIVLILGLILSVSTFGGANVPTNKENYTESLKTSKKHIITHCAVTCYQPIESQCDSDPLTTADGSKINLDKLKKGKIKWCAVSRDLLWLFPKNKPKRVYIEGFGIYEVKDLMNKRWKHKLDILIHPDDKTRYHLKNVKVKILL